MTWSQSWHDPLLWLMAQNETATLHYFVSMAECPKCGAKPGESCVTVIAYEPGKPAGKETPHHSPRVKKGHFGWNAYKGACKVDPKIKELEKQVRALAVGVARARRITALQEAMTHLQYQLDHLEESGWSEEAAVKKLKRAMKESEEVLDRLTPRQPE